MSDFSQKVGETSAIFNAKFNAVDHINQKSELIENSQRRRVHRENTTKNFFFFFLVEGQNIF